MLKRPSQHYSESLLTISTFLLSDSFRPGFSGQASIRGSPALWRLRPFVRDPPQSLSRDQSRSFFDEVRSMTVIYLPPREDPACDGMLEPSDAFTCSK